MDGEHMRVEHTPTRARRVRGTVAAALGALLVATGVLVPATSASAMTQVGAPPTGVPGSSVQAVVQNQAAGTGTWTITAPPNTTITAAQSVPAPGLGQFTCVPTNGGTQAACGASTWGTGNQVAITMTIDPASPLGTVAGSSEISPFEAAAPYSITVVAPPAPAAPTITAPPAGDESIATQPTITGTKVAGAADTTGTTLAATIDGEPLCTVDPATTPDWSCTPTEPLAVGQHTVSATQTDRFGQVSPAATSTFTVLAPAGLSVTQAGATQLYAGFPAIRTVTLANTGEGEARGVLLTADTGGLQVPVCELDGATIDCAGLAAGVDLGTIAPGDRHVLRLTVAARSGTVPASAFTITARASSTTAAVSPVESGSTVRTIAPGAPVITAPGNRTSTTERTPEVRGRGVIPNAVVTVRQGETVVCTATATRTTSFACTPERAFALGAVALTATQTYGGVESARASTAFTVTVATPAPPGGAGGLPGTGGGSTGGPGGAGGGTAPTAPSTPGSSSTGAGSGSGVGQGVGSGDVGGSTGPSSPPSTTPPAPGESAGNGNGNGNGGTDDGPLAMDLRFGTQRIVPGTAADMRGTLGPNASGATVAITFEARITTGMVYRNVNVEVDGSPLDCTVATSSFSCMIPLDPGQQADVDVRVYADPVNAPDTAVQQISLASNRASQSNAMTVTTAVAKGETEASQLADQITTFNATEFPGAMVPLLAMLLFALAATVVGRRATSGPAAAATASPTGSGPSDPSRASSPTAAPSGPTAAPTGPTAAPTGPTTDPSRPATDPPSGSNR
ncbi:Ig-like domain-containing protein [Curtobacterium sp. NPDC087082]|uniref:Ig-like domain-containing protein n=1 Tax=Curtobacterium sp. NPDC087082 TaxID=3363966 RepID=UPI00382DF8B3